MHHILYYINLERCVENNDYMINIMKEHNINYKRILGIDFKNNDLPKYEIKNTIIEPNIKEMAITLSHFKVLEEFVENNEKIDIAIISEDDISLRYISDFNGTLINIVKNAPENWNYISLHCSNKNAIKNNIALYYEGIFYHNINVQNLFMDNSAVFYIIKKEAAKQIIEKYKKDDKFIFDFKNKYPSIAPILRSLPNSYFYTKPIICVKDNNTNTLGIKNPHDYISNKIIKEFWGY